MKDELKRRFRSPTPLFFRKLREIGVAMASAAATLLMSPVDWPPSLLTLSGYVLVAGMVLAAISQVTVEDKSPSPG